MRRRIRGALGDREGDVEVGLQFTPMKEEALKFRRQGLSGDAETSVRRAKWSQRIEQRLTLNDQYGGREHEENQEERASGFHESLRSRKLHEILGPGGHSVNGKVQRAARPRGQGSTVSTRNELRQVPRPSAPIDVVVALGGNPIETFPLNQREEAGRFVQGTFNVVTTGTRSAWLSSSLRVGPI